MPNARRLSDTRCLQTRVYLGETPRIVKRWDSKSMTTISVKKRAAFSVSRLFFSVVESKGQIQLPVCDAAVPMVR